MFRWHATEISYAIKTSSHGLNSALTSSFLSSKLHCCLRGSSCHNSTSFASHEICVQIMKRHRSSQQFVGQLNWMFLKLSPNFFKKVFRRNCRLIYKFCVSTRGAPQSWKFSDVVDGVELVIFGKLHVGRNKIDRSGWLNRTLFELNTSDYLFKNVCLTEVENIFV